jgi:hypothetical protein
LLDRHPGCVDVGYRIPDMGGVLWRSGYREIELEKGGVFRLYPDVQLIAQQLVLASQGKGFLLPWVWGHVGPLVV